MSGVLFARGGYRLAIAIGTCDACAQLAAGMQTAGPNGRTFLCRSCCADASQAAQDAELHTLIAERHGTETRQ